MKTKQIVKQAATGSAAFLIAFAAVGLTAMAADTLTQVSAESVIPQPAQVEKKAEAEPISTPTEVTDESPAVTEDREAPSGLYAVDEKMKPSRAFRDVQYFSFDLYDYDKQLEDGSYGVPIPPKGSLMIGKTTYKFTRVAVGKDAISFQTEEKNGVSYRYTGKFNNFDYCETEEELPDVVGHLIKFENKKWVAAAEFAFSTQGCYCSH